MSLIKEIYSNWILFADIDERTLILLQIHQHERGLGLPLHSGNGHGEHYCGTRDFGEPGSVHFPE